MASGEGKNVSFPFVKNYMGLSVDDESMKSLPHAKAELYFHVALKAGEVGSMMGALIGAGGSFFRTQNRFLSVLNGARNGLFIGLPLGVLMTYSRMNSVSKGDDVDMEYAYFDRSYRLRNNSFQLLMDRTSVIGFMAGAATAAAKKTSVVRGGALGMSVGAFSGIVMHMILNSKDRKSR